MNETTPLLPTANSDLPNVNDFPTISSAVSILLSFVNSHGGISLETMPALDLYPAYLNRAHPIHAAAFRLAVILYSLADDKRRDLPSTSTEQSTLQLYKTTQDRIAGRRNLENIAIITLGQVLDVIEDILEHPDVYDAGEPSIEDVLLAPFREHEQSGDICLLDLLYLPTTPQAILKDKIVTLSLIRLWKLGYPRGMLLSNPPSVNIEHYNKLQRISDSVTSPRVIHGVHFLGHLLYLIILAHFLLSPPLSSPPFIGLRGSLIVIYSVSNIIFGFWTLSALLHWLTISSIITAMSFKFTTPFPDSNAYILLLVAFCVHIILLHFPGHYPTHLLLFEPSRTLPKTTLYAASLQRGFFTAFRFLLPLFFISALLFSFSMDGNILSFMVMSTPPYNARVAFVLLFCFAFILLSHFSTCGLLFSRPAVSGDGSIDGGWDDFDANSGIDARRSLVQAIIVYYPLRPLYRLRYPPPFNLPTLLLQMIPSLPRNIQVASWNLLVGPFAFIVAGFWGWGLV